MNSSFENAAENVAAFQKMWMESASKMVQATLNLSPNSDPAALRQMRSGIFQALAQSWEEFMRSPQFLQGMKQCMESAVSTRKMTGDFLAKVRNEMQAPSRDDIDSVMIAIRHLETRLLDRVETLSTQIAELRAHPTVGKSNPPKTSQSPRRTTNGARARQSGTTNK